MKPISLLDHLSSLYRRFFAPSDNRPMERAIMPTNGEDRLSDLHDDFLIYILSCLDAKCVARTCVLSKRWNKKLWIHHPDVYLNSKTFGKTSYKFMEFVDMVLTQRHKLNHKSRSFTFSWTFKSNIPQHLLNRVHSHAQLHDVRHFDLSIHCVSLRRSYPSKIFNPKTLTTLRLNLSNCYQGYLCTDFNLKLLHIYLSGCDALCTLWLEKIAINVEGGDVDLFSGLVSLTELHIKGCYIVGKDRLFLVGAPRLERLTILENISEKHYELLPEWVISSSVLKYLRTDLWVSESTLYNLPPYIEELEIDFLTFSNYRTEPHANWLINTISGLPHAKSVTVSKSTLQVLSKSYTLKHGVPLPRFEWEFLKVITTNELPTTEFPEYLPGLVGLTKNCLKTLRVEFV